MICCIPWFVILPFLVILPLYTKGPSWFSYYTKFFVYYLILTLHASLCIPIAAIWPKNSKNLLLTSKAMEWTSYLIGLTWNVARKTEAKFRLGQTSGTSVVIVNHQSSIDVLGLLSVLLPLMDGKCSIIAKQSLMYAGPFGVMAYLSDLTFIDRSRGNEAKMTITEAVKVRKSAKGDEAGAKVLVFPEGTRCHDPVIKDMRQFKIGAFKAAIEAQVPIQPVVFSHYNFFDKKRKIFEPSGITVRVLDPIPTDGLDAGKDAEDLANRTRLKMLEVFQQPTPT